MEFYNVKKRAKVSIDDSKVKKTVYGSDSRPRYAARATDDDGTNLTKFVSKDTYDQMNTPEE